MANRPITNNNIYDQLNTMRLEIKGDIRDLRNQFETLEAGRLTRAEGNINDLRIEMLKATDKLKGGQSIIGFKFIILQTIGYVMMFVILQALATKVFH